MTFEIFVFRAQTFATKIQNQAMKKPQAFVNQMKMGLSGMITQFLMGMCFAKTFAEGEKQWRKIQKQKTASSATKK